MPPSLRRRVHRGPLPPASPTPNSLEDSDSDETNDAVVAEDGEIDGTVPGEADDEEDEDGEEDDEHLEQPLPLSAPIPPNLREISSLASWTVSSSKPGCSIPQLRSPNTSLFWQSDGPQPHYLNIHFFKLVRIVGLRLYLDFEADESYTPTRIQFLAGSGANDLQEWSEMRLEQPRGWCWVDFSSVADVSDEEDDEDFEEEALTGENYYNPGIPPSLSAPSHYTQNSENFPSETGAHQQDSSALDPSPTAPRAPGSRNRTPLTSLPVTSPPPPQKAPTMPVLRAHLVQVKILENHQNGKDTHLRGLQIFARDNERVGMRKRESAKELAMRGKGTCGGGGTMRSGGIGGKGLGKSSWDVEPVIR